MRLPNAPPGLPHHPAPGLRGNPVLYTNRHAVSYFTVLLCGIPLSRSPVPVGQGHDVAGPVCQGLQVQFMLFERVRGNGEDDAVCNNSKLRQNVVQQEAVRAAVPVHEGMDVHHPVRHGCGMRDGEDVPFQHYPVVRHQTFHQLGHGLGRRREHVHAGSRRREDRAHEILASALLAHRRVPAVQDGTNHFGQTFMGQKIPLARLAQHLDEPLGPVGSGHLTFDLPGIVDFGEVEVGQYPLVHRSTAGGQLLHAGLGPVSGGVVRDPRVEADHWAEGGRAQEIIPETVAAGADDTSCQTGHSQDGNYPCHESISNGRSFG